MEQNKSDVQDGVFADLYDSDNVFVKAFGYAIIGLALLAVFGIIVYGLFSFTDDYIYDIKPNVDEKSVITYDWAGWHEMQYTLEEGTTTVHLLFENESDFDLEFIIMSEIAYETWWRNDDYVYQSLRIEANSTFDETIELEGGTWILFIDNTDMGDVVPTHEGRVRIVGEIIYREQRLIN